MPAPGEAVAPPEGGTIALTFGCEGESEQGYMTLLQRHIGFGFGHLKRSAYMRLSRGATGIS